MWRKKSSARIAELKHDAKLDRDKNRLKGSVKTCIFIIVIFLIMKILLSLTVGVDFTPYGQYHGRIIDIEDIPKYIDEILLSSIFIGVFGGLVRFLVPTIFTPNVSTTQMCNSCFSSKNYDEVMDCNCGGKYYPINEYEWVDEKSKVKPMNFDWISKYSENKNEG